MQDTSNRAGFHALLIGINQYLPNELPNGLYYKSLLGCVHDVNLVDGFLRRYLRIPDEHITRLTSSRPSEHVEPPEPRSQWPTYENKIGRAHVCTPVTVKSRRPSSA